MIGIFDSGIGGVTVFKEIIKELPNYKYIYYSDSYNNPYGDKTKEELYTITFDIVNYLVNEGCEIIVIACNTASAICKDYLRSKFNVPIICIEPACKMVYDYNPHGKTLIMATKGTLESEKFLEIHKKYDNHNTVLFECVGLADLIEQNNFVGIKNYLNNNLKQFKGIQNVVLGCTHYPLIKDELTSVFGNVSFFDGSVGVTKRLKQIINDTNVRETRQEIIFIDSSKNVLKEERFWEILIKH